jgi:uncharacterized repeat protein (TIGR01451 family)
VTLTNNGNGAQADNTGHEFTDTLPAGLTLTGASAPTGSISTAGNTVNWDGSLGLGGSVTITITATINSGTGGQTISNQGTISYDADANGSNEATGVTDDPGTPAANDPTSFVVAGAGGATVSATKTVSGSAVEGGTLTYTIVLTNSGSAAQGDNAGHEFTDTLPSSLTLVSANATSGTPGTTGNTVNWDGSIPAGGSVTITITATVNPGTAGTTISNQGTVSYDSDGDGTNDATASTDNPNTPAAGDSTSVTVGAPVAAVPTLSDLGLLALALALAAAALALVRRRRTV